MGRLGALTSLNLSNNSIKELPTELANLSEKVMFKPEMPPNSSAHAASTSSGAS